MPSALLIVVHVLMNHIMTISLGLIMPEIHSDLVESADFCPHYWTLIPLKIMDISL
jgi:hypothetical protein